VWSANRNRKIERKTDKNKEGANKTNAKFLTHFPYFENIE
jgi:hypothetical protein